MRSILGLVSLLLLLLPRVGSAQAAWGLQRSARLSLVPEAAAELAPDSELPRNLRSIEDTLAVSAEARHPVAARVAAEVLGGSLFGAGGMLGGGLVGIGIAESVTCGVDECLNGLGYVGASMVAGVTLAAPIGVYLAGRMAEGEGRFLPALAGSVASSGLTALTLMALSRPVSSAGVLALVVSPLVGSIIGYEVSHHFVSQQRRSAAARGVQIIPTAGVTPSGTGLFGLAGRF
jgi:hypothetical protein